MSTEHTPPRDQSDTEPTARLDEPTMQLGEPTGATSWEGEQYGATSWESEDEPGRRNPLSVTHLVMGLVFLGVAGLWLAQEVGVVAVDDMDLLVPLLLVVVGAAGLLAGVARAARRG